MPKRGARISLLTTSPRFSGKRPARAEADGRAQDCATRSCLPAPIHFLWDVMCKRRRLFDTHRRHRRRPLGNHLVPFVHPHHPLPLCFPVDLASSLHHSAPYTFSVSDLTEKDRYFLGHPHRPDSGRKERPGGERVASEMRKMTCFESSSSLHLLLEHDLFGKPVCPIFRIHALPAPRNPPGVDAKISPDGPIRRTRRIGAGQPDWSAEGFELIRQRFAPVGSRGWATTSSSSSSGCDAGHFRQPAWRAPAPDQSTAPFCSPVEASRAGVVFFGA